MSLFVSPVEYYHWANMLILKKLLKVHDFGGIFVSLNLPYIAMCEMVEKHGIDSSKLFFMDCVSKKINSSVKAENCICIQGPNSLTELSIALNELVVTGNFKFLFFDSISTLLIYNELHTAERFSNYLINKMRSFNIDLVLLSVDSADAKKLLPVLIQLVDRVIDLSK